MIRIAFHKNNLKDVFENAKYLKNLGYTVCLNAMGIELYDNQELEYLVINSEKYEIDYLYIADTYGSITEIQIGSIIENININKNKIKLGFHPHNNTLSALSNSLFAIKNNIDIVDTTLYGMGRGAGNLPTELFISYLIKNNNIISTYKLTNNSLKIITELIFNYIYKLNNSSWGYELFYLISGHFSIHPNYADQIKNLNINDFNIIFDIFEKISKTKQKNKFEINLLNDLLNE